VSAFDEQVDRRWMAEAMRMADLAGTRGEVPVGAVLIRDGVRVAEGCNQVIGASDPTAHAEIVALRALAANDGNYRLPGTTLYVTLEPCPMCAGAIVQARVARVVYAAADPKAGAHRSIARLLDHPGLNHRCEVTAGVLGDEASAMLTNFFRERR
jgi:tRNA(adenine34) deaminase